MKAIFFPCTLDGLPRHTGSRMIRCQWVADNWELAEIYDGTQRLKNFQLFVFQKAYLSRASQKLIYKLARWRDSGRDIKLAFDLCDPDFLDDKHRERMLTVMQMFDFATAPTFPLTEWLGQYLPVYLVPDGVDVDQVPFERAFVATENPSIVWMGYKNNATVLTEIAQAMAELGVIGDVVGMNSPVSFEKFIGRLVEYDILLNPRPDRPPFCYKSDNKSLVAWAAGVAVAREGIELGDLLNTEKRRTHVEAGMKYALGQGNISATVDAWMQACAAEGLL